MSVVYVSAVLILLLAYACVPFAERESFRIYLFWAMITIVYMNERTPTLYSTMA